jgi:aspartate-semialdehyde dehydrogenase
MLKVKNIEHFDFTGWDIALFSAGSDVARDHAPRAAAQGCVVIDNSSFWRMDPDVPLVVPEVNPDAIDGYKAKGIIANPNCSTAQMVVALKPLHDAARIRRVVVATYQSVSGAGKQGMDELFEQSRNIFVGDSNEPVKFTKQIAFNVIPHIDSFLDDGSTKEEWKMVVETKKILDPKIRVHATCVRVPVFVGHSEAINIEFEDEISAEQAQDILREAPGVMLVDKREDGGYVTPVECVGDGATFVSRVREDPTVDNGWHCGAFRTTCARALRSTRCRSPNCSGGVTSRRGDALHRMGTGRPVVLLHGLFSSAEVNWIKFGTATQLAALGFECLMPDLRVHGQSEAPLDPRAYPQDVLVRDAEALVAHLGLTDFDLVGFSLGSRTAARAVLGGMKPRRLVLSGMGLEGLAGWTRRQDFFLDVIDRFGTIARDDPAYFSQQFLKTMGVNRDAARLLLGTIPERRLVEGAQLAAVEPRPFGASRSPRWCRS